MYLHLNTLGVFTLFLFLTACRPDVNDEDISHSNGTLQEDSSESYTPHALNDGESDTYYTDVDSLSFLALGDSYTIGQSVAPEDRWPVQLSAKINTTQDECHLSEPYIIAQTGWTTQNLSDAMDDADIDNATYDLVSLLIGVNNQYQGLSIDQYAEQYEHLLQRAIAIADDNPNRVIVLSIPDYGYSPFGVGNQDEISTELAIFNSTCQSITAQYGVAYFNITPISQQWPEVDGLIAPDGLHPSGYQYGLWVEEIYSSVLDQLIEQ